MDHLVLDKETGEWRFFGFTTSTADVMFRQIREDVMRETGMDLDGVSIHTIRHTVATRLAQGGMGLARLQQWLGHADPKITAERYLHLIPSDLVAGLAILNGTGGTQDAYKATGSH
jgi:integrase